MAVIWLYYAVSRHRRTKRSVNALKASQEAGLIEPASLHPVIDPALCIGSGSCVDACPEKSVIGLIHGKAELVNPSHCIGHSACARSCPTQAITLVFGTERRGLDIPSVSPSFETNVPGMFIAGELGGMGLIRNAITQGKQAVDSIKKLDGIGKGNQLDLIIIGSGPAGIASALAAKSLGLTYKVLEQDTLGGTVAHYPRGKLVMTAPVDLPLVGKVNFRQTTKEKLMELWTKVTAEHELDISFETRVEDIINNGDGFTTKTATDSFQSRAVLLAIGRRGTPRKLGVPGEELTKVVYRLIDPSQYKNQKVLVVGGGDSAMEAACSIAEEEGTTVTLSYRSGGFSRAKQQNRDRVADNEAKGLLQVLLSSTVSDITQDMVNIDQQGKVYNLPNDAIIVCAGGILPTPFLKSIGIEIETKFGTA